MTSGPCREASYTAITLNRESNFTRREKNHSLFHWNTLTSPELFVRIWMLSKSVASMTTGTSMGQEICLIIEQFSFSWFYWKRNLQTDICGPGRDWQKCSIKTCVYFGSQWIHKTAYVRIFTESSWGPHCRKGRQFAATLYFGTLIYSYASSHEDTRSKSSSG